MLADWIRDISKIEAGKLMQAREQMNADPVGGYGMKRRVQELIQLLRTAMYPNVYYAGGPSDGLLPDIVEEHWKRAAELLYNMACDVLPKQCAKPEKGGTNCDHCEDTAETMVKAFMESLPEILRHLQTDVDAAYAGDPAARSREEVMLAYPAFETITIFRLAHRLFELGLPLIPRMMTEYAHQLTGIDIHPGATIGDYFFIDHGTGVVIGETCHIGHHVKLYQGVTLGAKSFPEDEEGHIVKGGKRHPDVGNYVVIYAGATVLGGDTVIGDYSTIGGSVWLTHSVPERTTVYNQAYDSKHSI